MKIWTAQDLLDKTFEFLSMIPKPKVWSIEDFNDNPPRLLRLKRINALLTAFDLTRTESQKNKIRIIYEDDIRMDFKEGDLTKNEIIPFLEGEFIEKREYSDYPNVLHLIKNANVRQEELVTQSDIYHFYKHFMKYRLEIDNVLRINDGISFAGTLGIRSAMTITDEITKDIFKNLSKLDKILIEIINPNGWTFTEDLLIKDFGFPTDNLDEIDLEYW